MSGNKVIHHLYAFVAVDSDGDEGIMAFQHGGGWMPMVGANMERVDQLRPIAAVVGAQLGVSHRLLRFTNREELPL